MHDFTLRGHSSVMVSPFSCLRQHAETWMRQTRGGKMKMMGSGTRLSLLPQLRGRLLQ